MRKYASSILQLVLSALALSGIPTAHAATEGAEHEDTVWVFILAGQSNMEGKAQNKLLEYQATAPDTKDLFQHLRKEGKWVVRDDVWIKFLDRHGGLSIGYGSRDRTGVELEFGNTLGDHFDEPVLLIKTAWGGHSLQKLFRSPSAGMPAQAKLETELEAAQKRVTQNNENRNRNDPLPTLEDIRAAYGSSYREMLSQIEETLADYETLFPALQGKRLKVAGFVWFQGWNDQYGGAEHEYAANLKHFILDVRKDLQSPKMPFIIGVMGQNGSQPAQGAMRTIQEAQLALPQLAEFQGNVKAVRTDVLVDKAAEQLYPEWRQRTDEWEQTGSDHGYHYLGSAIWFNRMGKAMGQAMLDTLDE